MVKYFLVLYFSFCSVLAFAQKKSSLTVNNTKVEYRKNPLGVESSSPRLSWELQSDQRSVLQKAYRIMVGLDPESLQKDKGIIWDSGKVGSEQSIQVPYAGQALQPAKAYFWKVKTWDNKGNESDWSEISSWQMGLPSPNDWSGARWIAYEELPDSQRIVPAMHGKGKKELDEGKNTLPLLRKEFEVKKPLKRATAFISGLGHFEMSLNGEKVGDHFLDPGWTDYSEHALYVTFNVTDQLKQGKNAVGVMLGNGFYHIPRERYRKLTGSFGYPKMISRIVLEYKDGSTEDIISDTSWKTAAGPVTFTSIYGGESYDARLEQEGWSRPGFRGNETWKPAIVVDGPAKLDPQLATPVKIFDNFTPKKITQPQEGVWVYDLGQNASGIVGISVQGPKGASVKIVPGELLAEDGTVSQKATGSPYFFEYTLKGDGTESWHPRFTYYGFRYVQVEGAVPEGKPNPDNKPVMVSLKGLHTRNAAEPIGDFNSSKELFDRTEELIDWAIRSNMVSVLTDCPHREKLGWLEQVHLMGNSVRYNYDIASLGKKIIRDMQVAQEESGFIPNIAPEYVEFNFNGDESFRDSPEWGSNGIIFPWYMYQWYGDRQILEESYPMMQAYIEYLKSKADNHIVSHGLSDWYDLGPERPGFSQHTPNGVTATAIYYYDLGIMSQVARMLGKPQDAQQYEQLAAEVKEAYNAKFFSKETKQYATGSQTANAMSVYVGLVEPEHKEEVVKNIIKDIRDRGNGLTAGDVGYRYLLQVLDQENRSDLIFAMNNRTDVPGYGYQLERGATALTESWQALPNVSNNHFMLGHILEWFYTGLAGIRPGENSVAFKKIEIRPQPVGDIASTSASHHSPYGTIGTDWKKGENSFELNTQIPANTTAKVYLPAKEGAQIQENGQPLKRNKDAKLIGYENGKAIIAVGSGDYNFTVKEAGL